MKTLLTITLLLSLIVSCAKKDQTSQVDFRSTLASVANDFPGGLMLYGKKNTGQSFGRIVSADELIEEVPNGIWDFYMIGWAGGPNSEKLSGVTQCAVIKGIALSGSYREINMNMTNQKCSHPDFGPTYNHDFGGDTKVTFINTLKFSRQSSSASSTVISSAKFGIKAFDIKLNGQIEDLGEQELISACFSTATFPYDVYNWGTAQHLNYPAGVADSPFAIHLGFYTNSICDDESRGGVFKHGLIGSIPNTPIISNNDTVSNGVEISYPDDFYILPED